MSYLRKTLFVILGLMVAAFALPGMAANQSNNKTFGIQMAVSVAGDGNGASTLTANLLNTSPKQSSSNFSSFDLFVNFGWNISNCSVAGATGTTTIDCGVTTPGHIVVQGVGPIKPGSPATVTFDVDATSCGDATWSANVWSGSQIGSGNFFTYDPANSSPISGVACAAVAACGFDLSGNPVPQPFDAGDAGTVTGFRWPYNQDGGTGAACTQAPLYVSDVDKTGNPIHVRWDSAAPTQQFAAAVFAYKVHYDAVPQTPKGGWVTQGNDYAVSATTDASNVAFVAAPLCQPTAQAATDTSIEAILPRPYGSVKPNGGINSSSTTLKVDTSTGTVAAPTAPPSFDIIVGGPNFERMTVLSTGSGNSGWTVTRGVGGTTGVSHPQGAMVMTTPLPIMPANNGGCTDYQNGSITCPPKYGSTYQAQMCLPVAVPNTAVGFPGDVWFLDIGDAWSKQ
jgi:hypothetical protein